MLFKKINLFFFSLIFLTFFSFSVNSKYLFKGKHELEVKSKLENKITNGDSSTSSFIKATILNKTLLPKNASAQQGITSDKIGNYYISENKIHKGVFVSKIVKLDKNLSQIRNEFILNPKKIKIWDTHNYKPHVGQVAIDQNTNLIYVPLMDIGTPKLKMIFGKFFGFITGKLEVYGKKTALLVFDSNLNYLSYIDWTNISSYLDAIDIDNGKIWYDCGYIGVLKLSELENIKNKKINIIKYYLNRKDISKAQGLKVSNNSLFYVPENDALSNRTKKKYWGVLNFEISNLKNSRFSRKINYPTIVHSFSIPEKDADLEAMDFVIGSTEEIYITTANDQGRNIYKVKLNF